MKILVTSLLIFILVMSSCQKQPAELVISGKISSGSSAAFILAQARISSITANPAFTPQEITLPADGRYSFSVPSGDLYEIEFSAVNHKALRLPLFPEKKSARINLDATLSAYNYPPEYVTVSIIGDWNRFSFRSATPMIRRDDGTFYFELPTPADSIQYQLVDAETDGRSINGTMADRHEYDGGGDYISIVAVKDGLARITFDPAQLNRNTAQNLPEYRFDQKHEYLSRLPEFIRKTNEERELAEKAMLRYQVQHNGGTAGFVYEMSGFKDELLNLMENNKYPVLAKAAALTLSESIFYGAKPEPELMKKIIDLVPITDPLWAWQYYLIPAVFNSALSDAEAQKLFEKELDAISAHNVRGMVLVDLGLRARQAGDQTRAMEIYTRLTTEFADLEELSYYIAQLNPDKRISPGKTVPDFEMLLLGSDKKISAQTLRGSYYLMDFWAVWCAPCVREMPKIHQSYEKYKNMNFTILSLSFDPKIEDVENFRRDKWPMPWLHSFVQGGFSSELAGLFEVDGIPKPVLVDPDGKIVAMGSELRGDDLDKTLDKFLARK